MSTTTKILTAVALVIAIAAIGYKTHKPQVINRVYPDEPAPIISLMMDERYQRIERIEKRVNSLVDSVEVGLDDELCYIMFFQNDKVVSEFDLKKTEIVELDNFIYFKSKEGNKIIEYGFDMSNEKKKELKELIIRYESMF